MEILIWVLIAYGMSNILVWSSIFRPVRQKLYDLSLLDGLHKSVAKFFSDLIQCMMCTSTWVGFFLSLTLYSPSIELMNMTPYFSWFFDGCMASGAVWFVNSLVEFWEGNRHTE